MQNLFKTGKIQKQTLRKKNDIPKLEESRFFWMFPELNALLGTFPPLHPQQNHATVSE